MARKCFVIMPFNQSFDGIWENFIRPTVTSAGDNCERADDVFSPGSIIEDVIKAISDSDYLIADLTGRNPNVFYELGYAHALDKPVILLTQDIGDVPFDLKVQRMIEYKDTAGGAADLKSALDRYIANI